MKCSSCKRNIVKDTAVCFSCGAGISNDDIGDLSVGLFIVWFILLMISYAVLIIIFGVVGRASGLLLDVLILIPVLFWTIIVLSIFYEKIDPEIQCSFCDEKTPVPVVQCPICGDQMVAACLGDRIIGVMVVFFISFSTGMVIISLFPLPFFLPLFISIIILAPFLKKINDTIRIGKEIRNVIKKNPMMRQQNPKPPNPSSHQSSRPPLSPLPQYPMAPPPQQYPSVPPSHHSSRPPPSPPQY